MNLDSELIDTKTIRNRHGITYRILECHADKDNEHNHFKVEGSEDIYFEDIINLKDFYPEFCI